MSQGPEAAREVLNCIHINKSLSGLAKRKDKKVCCIHVQTKYQVCTNEIFYYYITPNPSDNIIKAEFYDLS